MPRGHAAGDEEHREREGEEGDGPPEERAPPGLFQGRPVFVDSILRFSSEGRASEAPKGWRAGKG
jgi:hypothetical protein